MFIHVTMLYIIASIRYYTVLYSIALFFLIFEQFIRVDPITGAAAGCC